MNTRNFLFTIEYDGTEFHGWQIQPTDRSVQGDIETAIRDLLPDQKITLYGGGRTDSGVHAREQIANIHLDTKLAPFELKNAVNARLKRDVRLQNCRIVPNDFHSRYSPIAREYSYTVVRNYSAIDRRLTWYVKYPLDFDLLNQCAARLKGEHDFTAFCKATAEVNHKRCIVYRSEWNGCQDRLVYHVTANRFLQHMVRYLAGTMVEVARGRFSLDDFDGMLNQTRKDLTVVRAPAQGLVLEKLFLEQTADAETLKSDEAVSFHAAGDSI